MSFSLSIVAGTIGCFTDSFLGAFFKNKCWIINEHINLSATIMGAIVGILLA